MEAAITSPNRQWFSSYKPFDNKVGVQIGHGSSMLAAGYGRIETSVGNFENVFYVPQLVTNLFSIRSATQQGIVVQYSMNDVKFIKDGLIVLRGTLQHGAQFNIVSLNETCKRWLRVVVLSCFRLECQQNCGMKRLQQAFI